MKNTHGGNRKGAGPKFLPKGEGKIQLQVGIEKDFVEEWGGKVKMQDDIKEWIYDIIYKSVTPL